MLTGYLRNHWQDDPDGLRFPNRTGRPRKRTDICLVWPQASVAEVWQSTWLSNALSADLDYAQTNLSAEVRIANYGAE